MKMGLLLFIATMMVNIMTQAQQTVPYFGKINWVNGFAKEITGETLSYFSAYPDYATTSLLTRTTNGTKTIEWETAPVPQNLNGQFVYFSWVAAHSSGSSSGIRHFDLYLDDEKLLTFSTYPANQHTNWKFAAPDSAALVFQQTRRDGAGDAHGLAYLRLPLSKVKPGMPVKLKVVGQAQNSNDWYMTFKFSFEEKIDLQPMPFILKNGRQPIVLTALHFGKNKAIHVTINNKEAYDFILQNGVNSFDLPVPASQKEDSFLIKVTSGKQVLENRHVKLNPVKYRELHFIHHAHTDIGYSHLQPEVIKIHNKNIDDALHMIEKTKDYPEGAKFKWNVESLWAVENYLREASPVQKEKFIKAVKEGSICLSAFYANITTGLSQPEEMFHLTEYAEKLKKELGFSFSSAMMSDIPGNTWTMVTAFAKAGLKYFSSGPNYLGDDHPYGGDRVGHFVKTWGDKPVWWTSPSGEEKILYWTAGKGYSSWHGTAIGAVADRGSKKIAAYLNQLDGMNYPYEMVQWRYNIVADNGPIDSTISDFVKQWNEKYASPKIILNTTDKLFEEFELKHGKEIPVVKGDITPYWEDGAISTAKEQGETRVNSLRLQQLTTLYTMLKPKEYNEGRFYEAWRNILLFNEHTWGAYNSISEPDKPFVTEQWRIKKQYLLDGTEQVNNLEKELLQPVTNVQSKKIAVFNTLSWKRSGPVVITSSVNGRSVIDAAGNKWPLQKLSNGNYVFMAAEVPALGTALYKISEEEPTAAKSNSIIGDNSISNGKLSLQWDKQNGSITKLFAGDNFNYAGEFNQQGLNSYWYVAGLVNPAGAITNGNVSVKITESGPVQTTISFTSSAPGANNLTRIITLYAGSDVLEIKNFLDKKAIRTKEGVHYGFPFNSSLKKTTADAGYGTQQFLSDQLPGSNMDFLYGRRWMDVSSMDKGIQLMLLETPMIEPGNIIDERQTINQTHKEWKKEAQPTSTWFSYVMNNYWHTNFKIDQDGVNRSKYALRPHGMFSYSETEKKGTEFAQPLMAVPANETASFTNGLFELTNNRIVVTSITPQADGGFVIRLFNPEPLEQQTNFVWKSLQPVSIIDLVNGEKKQTGSEINLAGMGVKEIKILNQ